MALLTRSSEASGCARCLSDSIRMLGCLDWRIDGGFVSPERGTVTHGAGVLVPSACSTRADGLLPGVLTGMFRGWRDDIVGLSMTDR
jgi:hypothetical protein